MNVEWIIAGVAVVVVIIIVVYFITVKSDIKPIISVTKQRDHPLGAFQSGQASGTMSQPLFLSDILTMKPGDIFEFQTNHINGSVKKGHADKWELLVFRENNERQSIDFNSWGDLSYKLNQYMVGSRYFIVNMNGSVFHVGKVKTGPVRKIKGGNDDFETSMYDY